MELYFLRHGLAGDRETWEGDDRLRPLTKKGKRQLRRTGETLAVLGLKVDRIITSPLERACQTAEIVAENLYMQKKVVEDERLSPGFNVEKLAAILADHADREALMLVGHEPDFSETISALIGGGKVVAKKGGLARVDIPDAKTLQGELIWLIPPKILIL